MDFKHIEMYFFRPRRITKKINSLLSENINNNEYLPGHYTDLTSLKHKRPLHSAPNHESVDFFRGFHL